VTSSVNFAQPDITLRLDPSGVIRRAVLANAIANEGVSEWLGRRWSETVATDEAPLQEMLDTAWAKGVSPAHQVRQRFPSGRELAVEYTTVRLGADSGLIAIGRSLEAVAELRSRLTAAKTSMERSAWKLRDFETRTQLLFDSSTQPVLLISSGDLRIIEANPAATGALGLARDGDLLPEIVATERDTFRAMLASLREQGTVPGIVVHLGAERRPWLVRASLVSAAPTAVVLLQLAPAGISPSSPVEESGKLGKPAMREMVGDAVASVERNCILAALRLANGNRAVVAQMLGISQHALDEKLEGFTRE
jgi:transcriptional regulator PpsR